MLQELDRLDLSARLARIDEDLRQVETSEQELEASYKQMRATNRELLGATEWLYVSTGELEASYEAMKAKIKQLSKEQKQQAGMLRWHIGEFHAGEGASYGSPEQCALCKSMAVFRYSYEACIPAVTDRLHCSVNASQSGLLCCLVYSQSRASGRHSRTRAIPAS